MNLTKNFALWIIIALLLVALFNLFQGSSSRGPQAQMAFSDFLMAADEGQIGEVTIQGQNITGRFGDGRAFTTFAPRDFDLVDRLEKHGVRISALPVDEFYVALADTSGNTRDPSHQTYRYYEAGWRCRASENNPIPGFPPGQPERCQLAAGAKGKIDPPPFDPDAAYVGKWVLYSPGPDNLHSYGEWAMYRPNLVTGVYLYSPTNGTKSVGDLVRWGT